jgi:hypothetical protein
MKRPFSIPAAVATGVFLGTNAIAGPFGLSQGMTLEQIGGRPMDVGGKGKYMITEVPKPHSAFGDYVIQVGPKSGLCWVKSMGKPLETSVHGTELQSAFHDMETRLEAAYGKHLTIDELRPESIWNRPNEWMQGLAKRERELAARWSSTDGSQLPKDIRQVELYAVPYPTSLNKGLLMVEYEFANFDACKAEFTAQEDDRL